MVSMQVVYDDILKENSQLKSQVSVAFSLNELGYINHADALPKNWRKWDALIEAWAISTNWRPTNVVVTANYSRTHSCLALKQSHYQVNKTKLNVESE